MSEDTVDYDDPERRSVISRILEIEQLPPSPKLRDEWRELNRKLGNAKAVRVRYNLINGTFLERPWPGDPGEVAESTHLVFEHGESFEVHNGNRWTIIPSHAVLTVEITEETIG